MWPITGLTHGRSVADPAVGALRLRGVGQRAGAPVFANPLNVAALVLIGAFAICAVLAPIVAPYDPLAQALGSRLEPPSPQHWLGTDQLGRDIASRLLYGARISLVIWIVVVALACLVGTVAGPIARAAGRRLHQALGRRQEGFPSVPARLPPTALARAPGPRLPN